MNALEGGGAKSGYSTEREASIKSRPNDAEEKGVRSVAEGGFP